MRREQPYDNAGEQRQLLRAGAPEAKRRVTAVLDIGILKIRACARVPEKRRATYDLETIKAEFATPAALRVTLTAERGANALGLARVEVLVIIQGMTRAMLHKSMTSMSNPRIWQDVYHVPNEATGDLYVKFTLDDDGHLLISFKRWEEGDR